MVCRGALRLPSPIYSAAAAIGSLHVMSPPASRAMRRIGSGSHLPSILGGRFGQGTLLQTAQIVRPALPDPALHDVEGEGLGRALEAALIRLNFH